MAFTHTYKGVVLCHILIEFPPCAASRACKGVHFPAIARKRCMETGKAGGIRLREMVTETGYENLPA